MLLEELCLKMTILFVCVSQTKTGEPDMTAEHTVKPAEHIVHSAPQLEKVRGEAVKVDFMLIFYEIICYTTYVIWFLWAFSESELIQK